LSELKFDPNRAFRIVSFVASKATRDTVDGGVGIGGTAMAASRRTIVLTNEVGSVTDCTGCSGVGRSEGGVVARLLALVILSRRTREDVSGELADHVENGEEFKS
jgi:hypothetical protein